MICDVCLKKCIQDCERFIINIEHRYRKVGSCLPPSENREIKMCKHCMNKRSHLNPNLNYIDAIELALKDYFS